MGAIRGLMSIEGIVIDIVGEALTLTDNTKKSVVRIENPNFKPMNLNLRFFKVV
jgi:hypothetical protein